MNKVLSFLIALGLILGLALTSSTSAEAGTTARYSEVKSSDTTSAARYTTVHDYRGSPINVTRVWGGHDNAVIWEEPYRGRPHDSKDIYTNVQGFKSYYDARCAKITGPGISDGMYRVSANKWYRIGSRQTVTVYTTSANCGSRPYIPQ